jgi:hypothetical protein
MKKNTFLFFLIFINYLHSQIVNIPDANLKSALVNFTYADTNNNILKLDANNDNEIQKSEANGFTGSLDISSQGISNLTGLEEFTNITELHCGGSNVFTVLDLSKNIELVKVYARNTGKIEHIDVTKNIKLEELYCDGNNLDDIDVTNNVVLTQFDCSNNQLTTIDLSKNILLDQLVINENKLTSLNTSFLENLTGLYCNNTAFGTTEISNIDFSKNLKLKYLELKNIKLKTLNISKNIDLLHINLIDNELSSDLDLSGHDDLVHVYLSNNKLTGLNVSNGFNNNSNASFKLQTLWTNGNPNLTYICVDDLAYAEAQLKKIGQTDSWMKDATTTYTTNCTLSNKEFDFTSSILIYPNPVNDILKVNNNSHYEIKKIQIFDISGKEVIKTKKTTIKLKKLKKGIYIVRIEESSGKYMTKKIIKK